MGVKKYTSLLVAATLLSGCSVAPAPADDLSDNHVDNHVDNQSGAYVADPAFDNDTWQTNVSRAEVIETALAKTFRYLESRQNEIDYTVVNVHIDPVIPEEHHEWIDKLGKDAMLAAPGLDGRFDVIIGMDTDFMHAVVSEKGLEMPVKTDHSGSRPCPYSYGGCTSATSLWAGWANQPLDRLDENLGISRNVLHEAMHAIQDDMDPLAGGQVPPRDMENFRPVWLTEGSAEFWSYALADYVGLRKYGHGSERIEYTPLVKTEEWGGNDDEPYEWGQVAWEYLIAHKGFEVYLDVYSNLGEGMHFDDAFEAAAGIGLKDFYATFDLWVVDHVAD